MNSAYVHIPFCTKKCYYCDFVTFETKEDRYIEYLKKEILLYPKYKLRTLYFGGGTPSVLDADILNEFIDLFSLDTNSEITIEFNPESNLEKLKLYKANRLSIGIQSFDDNILKVLGRLHDAKRAKEIYFKARESFSNISIDLMFALPNQTLEMVKKDLEEVKALAPEHISIYSLIWKENTPFFENEKRGLLNRIDQDLEADMYEYIIDYLADLGYEHYEISSFAKERKYSNHNLTYWNNEEYLGLGLGAAGYLDNLRYNNFKSFSKYYEALDSLDRPIEKREIVSNKMKREYQILMQLRLLNIGLEKSLLNEEERDKIEKFITISLLKEEDGRIKLTRRGLFLSNEIFEEFV